MHDIQTLKRLNNNAAQRELKDKSRQISLIKQLKQDNIRIEKIIREFTKLR